jgi:hypothetical protein
MDVADHGQKRELGGVTSLGRLDITGPITEGRVLITPQIAAPPATAEERLNIH